ncbi:uncharacterized protein C8Q71DRAFT_863218 [Rhodofomes roseus]|uniref:Uncharacterized protein n=1 Tax=Rhodofomes roseus TaxID=34475 RepID=A0ABQ8JZG2_9APHY|nr:uncharacterized protein C8Q71DRAFT_863218 [Rhodofomes roseus]KAH9829451.1 hypothetical protein C8Q71DRAFT_863218 [Rhodofomes roseus]
MFARPARALYRSRATVRLNSTVAPAASAQTGKKAAPKRTVPMLEEFGDIKIPSARRGSAGWEWAANVGLGSGLADKLARRQQQNARGDSEANDVTPRAPRSAVQAEQRRSNQDKRAPQGGERNQNGANRNQYGANRSQDGANRSNNTRAQGGDRAARPQRSDTQNRSPRQSRPQQQTDARRSSNGRFKREETAEAAAAPAESAAPSPPIHLDVQRDTAKIALSTSELDTLFVHKKRFASPARAVAAVKPGARDLRNATAAVGGRPFERRSGDYSRYLPQDLGTSFPELLGPLGNARLLVGRRTEVGFKSRERILGTVQSLVVNKVVENQPA